MLHTVNVEIRAVTEQRPIPLCPDCQHPMKYIGDVTVPQNGSDVVHETWRCEDCVLRTGELANHTYVKGTYKGPYANQP